MALFLATHTNKLDRKGRLSVPALFRGHLNWQNHQQFVALRSHCNQATFVSYGASFQIWHPDVFKDHQRAARAPMKQQRPHFSLIPKVGDAA